MNKNLLLSGRLLITILLSLPVSVFSQNIDICLLRSINSQEVLPSDKFFRAVSNSEAYIVAAIPVTIGTIGLIRHDEQILKNACISLSAVVVSSGLTNILKYTINRDRPFITYQDIKSKSSVRSPSFPSGHTSNAFAIATSLTIAYPKWFIIVPAYSWAGTVAYSRMDLGVHYPSDVIAGAVIGAGSAWLSHFINKKLIGKTQ